MRLVVIENVGVVDVEVQVADVKTIAERAAVVGAEFSGVDRASAAVSVAGRDKLQG